MKRAKIFYWCATSIVALMGVMAGIMYFASPMMAAEFKHLGFPDYLRIELGIAKIIGAFALVLPIISNRIKEWAYAGFAIVFTSAIIAHSVVEGASAAISPLVALLFLVVSYVYFAKVQGYKAAVA
jgi:hypothetical protein